jgi:peroxiredoxin Q/BCP
VEKKFMPEKKPTVKKVASKKITTKKAALSKKSASESSILGKKIPAFTLPMTGDQTITAHDLKGKVVVIFFYPKDNTSGCTAEGENFRDEYLKFKKKGVAIYGVSRDSVKSHEGFKAKFQFQFDLISDAEEVLCKIFDVMKMKSMYGRQYLGLDRSTFVLQDGKVIQEWRGVKVPGHVAEVWGFVQKL